MPCGLVGDENSNGGRPRPFFGFIKTQKVTVAQKVAGLCPTAGGLL